MIPRCLLAWAVCCGVAWTCGLVLALVDLWGRVDINKEREGG
jgi:hypothetical protein